MSSRRHAWIDASAGVAGDMLLGALIDAGADLAVVQQAVDAVIADSVRLVSTPVTRAGQHANRISVEVITQDVPVREWTAIEDLLATADLAAPVRDRALATFGRLAEAEGRIHHLPRARCISTRSAHSTPLQTLWESRPPCTLSRSTASVRVR